MITENLNVKKRNGTVEPLILEKLHLMVEEACRGLSGVSASQVEMHSGIQFYDGITTEEIQKVLVKSASDLISLDAPNYQYVAARLLLFSLRKQIYGGPDIPHLEHHINTCVSLGVYDPNIYEYYSKEEIEKANTFIDHDRDFMFTYAGLKQAVDKYLCQDRSDGTIYETPQFMYIMIALVGFSEYPKETRMGYVKRFYDAISKHKINLPTPVMASVRTTDRQYVSCCLIEVDDTLDSICASDWAMRRYVAGKSGVGLDVSRIRSLKSKIRGGKALSTGKVKYIQAYERSLESVYQGGLRKGSLTCYVNVWDKEIENIIELKNETGNDDDSARKLDYNIKMSRLFYERFIKNQDISLFCPNDVPGLIDAFGTDSFDELYVSYENNPNIPKKTINMQDLMIRHFFNSRSDTGRYYVMNIDHSNSHSSFKDKINMSNLCVSGDTKVKVRYPWGVRDDQGQIFDWRVTEERVTIYEFANIVSDFLDDLGSYDYDISNIPPVQILTYDLETYQKVYSDVTAIAETSASANVVWLITDSDKNLVLTPDHQVYTTGRGYVKAGELVPGDELLTEDGNVNVVSIEKQKEPIPVYDLTVEDTHNFYANGILVHNCVEITLPTVPIQHIDDVGTVRKVKVKVPKDKVAQYNKYLKNNGNYLYF